jgi:phage baseplate assembly protein W
MPLIGSTRKQSTFDLNNNIKIGVAFPLDETNIFNGTETVTEQAKSNLINLLLTNKGERVNLPNFGIGVKRLLFEQNISKSILIKQIKKQAKYYIPNIDITDIQITRDPNKHSVFMIIVFRSLLDQGTDAIRINFK